MMADWVAPWVEDGPGRAFLRRLLQDLHPNVRYYFAPQMLTNVFFRDPDIRAMCIDEHGFAPPSTMLVSPTIRFPREVGGEARASRTNGNGRYN